jgi:hypothetical protein
MLKRTALMESISSNLHSFLKKTGKNLSLADRKFLRDGLIGLIRAGQPIVWSPLSAAKANFALNDPLNFLRLFSMIRLLNAPSLQAINPP